MSNTFSRTNPRLLDWRGMYLLGFALLGAGLALWGCHWFRNPEVVVYTSLDKSLVEPIFQQFTQTTGIPVHCRFAEEDGPVSDLLAAMVDERGRPKYDLIWHGEPVQVVRLRQKELLAAYEWPESQRFSSWAKSPDGRWHGLAARVRVLLLYRPAFSDPKPEEMPSSLWDLANPKYRGKVAMACPTRGTAAAHLACLFALWGPDRAKQFLRQLRENQIRFFDTEEQTAHQVAQGDCILALTDSDQAIRQIEKGSDVWLVYPDQREDQPGALFFPTVIALFREASHPDPARRLADYLLSTEVETQLTHSPAAHIPLNYEVTAVSRIRGPDDLKAMKVDFQSAASSWDQVVQFVQQEILPHAERGEP